MRIQDGCKSVLFLLTWMKKPEAIDAALKLAQDAICEAQFFLDSTDVVFDFLTQNLDYFSPEQLLAFWPLTPHIINRNSYFIKKNVANRVKLIHAFLDKMSPTTIGHVLHGLLYNNASRKGVSTMRRMLEKGHTLWDKDLVSLVVPAEESVGDQSHVLLLAAIVARELEGENAPPANYVAESGALFRMMVALTCSANFSYHFRTGDLKGYFGAIDTVNKITKSHIMADDAAALAFSRTFCPAKPCWAFLVITSVVIASSRSAGREYPTLWRSCAQLLSYMAIAGPQMYTLPVPQHGMSDIVLRGQVLSIPEALSEWGDERMTYESHNMVRLQLPVGSSVFSVLTDPRYGSSLQKRGIVTLILPILRQAFLAARLRKFGLPTEIVNIVWYMYLKACGMDIKLSTFCSTYICITGFPFGFGTGFKRCSVAHPCKYCSKMFDAPSC